MSGLENMAGLFRYIDEANTDQKTALAEKAAALLGAGLIVDQIGNGAGYARVISDLDLASEFVREEIERIKKLEAGQ